MPTYEEPKWKKARSKIDCWNKTDDSSERKTVIKRAPHEILKMKE
jgi:hypothetical protein